MNHGSLFSGIGGFDLAAQWCDWQNIFQVEIDKFCIEILNKNFPDTIKYNDIKKTDFTSHRGEIDILTGGFPCQPFSVAGKRKGRDDNRFLWGEMLRAVQEIRPRYVVAENVYGILNISEGMVFQQVCTDLENEGYEVQPIIIPACAVNVPHKRDRIWFVAYSKIVNGERSESEGNKLRQSETETGNGNRNVANAGCVRQKKSELITMGSEQSYKGTFNWDTNWIKVATEFCRMDDGISDRVDRLKSLGNAIVPQVAYQIFQAIQNCVVENSPEPNVKVG